MAPFRLSSPALPDILPARELFPKNLTIRFGAHRASVYGSISASKTAALTAAAKDPARESHARGLCTNNLS
jgi:hypothetical protein